MSKTIYVGNLSYTTTEQELRDLFAPHGVVESARVMTDRDTGQSRGFAFVDMPDADAVTAMQALDGTDFGGRALRVNEARPRGGGGDRRASRQRYDRW